MKIAEIVNFLQSFAPKYYQESYDNVGLLVGNSEVEVKQILITLDVTEEIIKEAILNDCNLIIAHHPIIFKGIKSLTGSNYVERTVITAIKNDIAIFASHTNLDNIKEGVNKKMAEKLGLNNIKILAPKKGLLKKLTVFVPKKNVETLKNALHEVGGGCIGNYRECAFLSEGVGTFMPNDKAMPHIGSKHNLEKVEEIKIEMLVPAHLENIILKTMKANHPYEEVAYFMQNIDNENQDIGSGMIGDLPQEMRHEYFLEKVKQTFRCKSIKHTKLLKDSVKKVALCGGSGSSFLKDAIAQKADVFISSDFKYHDYFEAEDKIIITDIGHYESEQFTKELLFEIISKKFPNIAVLLSKVNTNPVFYF